MIGFTCNEPIDVIDAFLSINDKVIIAKDNNGAVYKADNWEMVGETSGLPDHKSSSMKWNNKEELKELFVKPTGENKKLIFYKEL